MKLYILKELRLGRLNNKNNPVESVVPIAAFTTQDRVGTYMSAKYHDANGHMDYNQLLQMGIKDLLLSTVEIEMEVGKHPEYSKLPIDPGSVDAPELPTIQIE